MVDLVWSFCDNIAKWCGKSGSHDDDSRFSKKVLIGPSRFSFFISREWKWRHQGIYFLSKFWKYLVSFLYKSISIFSFISFSTKGCCQRSCNCICNCSPSLKTTNVGALFALKPFYTSMLVLSCSRHLQTGSRPHRCKFEAWSQDVPWFFAQEPILCLQADASIQLWLAVPNTVEEYLNNCIRRVLWPQLGDHLLSTVPMLPRPICFWADLVCEKTSSWKNQKNWAKLACRISSYVWHPRRPWYYTSENGVTRAAGKVIL